MSDRDLQAPWIGLCREDYYGYELLEEEIDDCIIEDDEED